MKEYIYIYIYIYITTSFLIRLDSEGKNIYITSGDRVHFDERMIE
jgi:hypothetical protein